MAIRYSQEYGEGICRLSYQRFSSAQATAGTSITSRTLTKTKNTRAPATNE
jgi:hypothetical protein